jgi:predicted transcriptional regulator
MNMNGLTIREIAKELGITPNAVMYRLITAGIEPKDHAGKTNIYAEDVIEKIRSVPGKGRPRKTTPDK